MTNSQLTAVFSDLNEYTKNPNSYIFNEWLSMDEISSINLNNIGINIYPDNTMYVYFDETNEFMIIGERNDTTGNISTVAYYPIIEIAGFTLLSIINSKSPYKRSASL